jgi:hypothetical protein
VINSYNDRTFHLVGPEADLDRIAGATLKIGLADLTNAFGPSTSGGTP